MTQRREGHERADQPAARRARGARRGGAARSPPRGGHGGHAGRHEQQAAGDHADAGEVVPVEAGVDGVQAVRDDAEADREQPDHHAERQTGRPRHARLGGEPGERRGHDGQHAEHRRVRSGEGQVEQVQRDEREAGGEQRALEPGDLRDAVGGWGLRSQWPGSFLGSGRTGQVASPRPPGVTTCRTWDDSAHAACGCPNAHRRRPGRVHRVHAREPLAAPARGSPTCRRRPSGTRPIVARAEDPRAAPFIACRTEDGAIVGFLEHLRDRARAVQERVPRLRRRRRARAARAT